MGKIYTEVKHRPRYHVADRTVTDMESDPIKSDLLTEIKSNEDGK